MKPQSCKQKGRSAQKEVVEELLKTFPELTERDVRSTSMGCSGDDILLSEKAFNLIPYSIEVKKQEKISIWQALNQVEERAKGEPLLIFKRNRSKTYCAVELLHFLQLLRKLTIHE